MNGEKNKQNPSPQGRNTLDSSKGGGTDQRGDGIVGNFRNDLQAEQVLTSWLDEHLYPNIDATSTRVDDVDLQHAGVDLELERLNGETLLVDEKATLHHLQRPLPTFAFELSYLRNGEPRIGWLHDSKKVTTAYMLVWPRAKASKLTAASQLIDAEAMLIRRRTLISALNRESLDETRCAALAEMLRSTEHEGKFDLGNHDIWAYRSPAYDEAPVNLVIRRSWLAKLAILQATSHR